MEVYTVTGYKGTRTGWEADSPIIDTTEVKAKDSFEAAERVIKDYLGKPTKLKIIPHPPGTTGMFLKTLQPKIILHVVDLNIIKPPQIKSRPYPQEYEE